MLHRFLRFALGFFDDLFCFCLADEMQSAAAFTGLPHSDSGQEHQLDKMPPSRPSSQSLKSSTANIAPSDTDSTLYSLIAPPPRQHGPKLKTRCSTLPSRPRGSEACYSLPRPSHSSSLSRFQQTLTVTPLVPLDSSSSTSSRPPSPPQASVWSSSSQPAPSQSATQPKATSELFTLKGPPPQQPRSRAKVRCSTLPPQQRAPGPEESSAKTSHSTSLTKLEECIPPSPSELKRNTPV